MLSALGTLPHAQLGWQVESQEGTEVFLRATVGLFVALVHHPRVHGANAGHELGTVSDENRSSLLWCELLIL